MKRKLNELIEKTRHLTPAADRHEMPDLSAPPQTGVGIVMMKTRKRMVEEGRISHRTRSGNDTERESGVVKDSGSNKV